MAKMTEEQLAYFREKNRKWREANREKADETVLRLALALAEKMNG